MAKVQNNGGTIGADMPLINEIGRQNGLVCSERSGQIRLGNILSGATSTVPLRVFLHHPTTPKRLASSTMHARKNTPCTCILVNQQRSVITTSAPDRLPAGQRVSDSASRDALHLPPAWLLRHVLPDGRRRQKFGCMQTMSLFDPRVTGSQ